MIILKFLSVFSAIVYLTWQYLIPSRNPSEINCLLPSQFRDLSVEKFTRNDTVLLFFAPVRLRTSIISVGVFLYGVVLLAAMLTWFTASIYRPGIELLKVFYNKYKPNDIQQF